MKKKNILIIAIIVLLVILLFPIPLRLKDGGSIRFKAILYSITKYHQIDFEVDSGYVDGVEIEILGAKILDTRNKKTETLTIVEERTKLEDLKITAKNIDTTKLVKFDGVLYGKSNALIDYAGDFNKSIGKIDYLIEKEYLPMLDGETNCEELLNCDVLEATEKSMVLNVNNVAVLFEAIDKRNIKKSNGESLYDTEDTEYSSFVGTILEETTKYMIVEPNEDEEERKSSDKIVVNYGTDHIDYLYGVGRKVVIYYKGGILETYPAQIKSDNISIDGYDDFKIEVKPSNKIEKKRILNNKDLNADYQDYNLYFYGLDEVNVTVDNKTMSLEDALKSGKMTIQGIIQKANKDFPNAISYDDGGSMEYHYENYTIIKLHKLDGNRDVYIGAKDMIINNIL